MSNLINLLTIEFRQSFNSQSRKKNVSTNVTLLLTFFLMLALGIYIAIFYNRIFFYYAGTNVTIYLTEGMVSYFIFNQLIIATKKVFIGKDYDLLESMPIKKRDIVIAKFLNLYLLGLFYALPILFPSFCVAFYYTKDSWYIISGIISVILTPMFPIVISGFLATIFSLISAKSDKFSQTIDFIFNLLTILVIVVLSMSISFNQSSEQNTLNVEVFEKMIYLNPTFLLVKESFTSKFYIIFYVVLCVALFLLMASFVSLLYRRIHILICGSRSHNKYVRKELEVKSELKTLVSFERKKLFGTKMYLLQTIIGGTLGIVISTILAIAIKSITLEQILESTQMTKKSLNAYLIFVVIAINYFMGIVVPSQGLINLEGKQFELLKSMPIDVKKYVKAKLIISYSISITFSLIVSSILVISANRFFTPITMIAIYICPVLFVVFENNLLLLTNLRNPIFDWVDEQQLIKSCQSGFGVLLDFIGIIIGVALMYLGVLLSTSIFREPNNYFAFGFYLLFYIIANSIVLYLLNKKSEDYFKRA